VEGRKTRDEPWVVVLLANAPQIMLLALESFAWGFYLIVRNKIQIYDPLESAALWTYSRFLALPCLPDIHLRLYLGNRKMVALYPLVGHVEPKSLELEADHDLPTDDEASPPQQCKGMPTLR
jgi:hypothetical protein